MKNWTIGRLKILEWPHEALSTKCEKVEDFGPYLHQALDEMWKAMEGFKGMDAMGLAANQVGVFKQMFIMKDLSGNKIDFINPTWEADDPKGGWANIDEGCLSTPGLFSKVYGRYNTITVWAKDRNGEDIKMVAEGIEAVCIQHEVDHLAGIFWFDRMKRNPRREMIRQWKEKGGKVQ